MKKTIRLFLKQCCSGYLKFATIQFSYITEYTQRESTIAIQQIFPTGAGRREIHLRDSPIEWR